MKKRILLSCITLCSVVLCAMAQRGYNFNAAALNVDGLPNKILGIEINPDGKEAAGASELCGILANSGWDIVGFSEDFNFHSELVAAPASTYYNFGAHGGSVSGLSNSTDGLGFACAKRFTMAGGTKVKWNDHYGETDHGADGLITKGFRVYNVILAQGIVVDVYVLHMDAEDSAEDIAARKKQLTQLATYIKNNHNNRPVIILGDTNCRYTRDELKTAFIDVINADSRFTIKDAWVELIWGGTYPTYGSGAMMTHEYGMQKGEIVDKVFYINTTASNLKLKANSYLHDESVTTSDHKPVVVNFTLTDPNGTPLTDAEKENNWTLEESVAGNKKPTWEGELVVSGTTYYMMNVGTGEYIKWGGAYLTEGVAGNAGTPIKAVANGNVWNLQTSTARANCYLGDGDYTYLDRPVGESNWYLEPVSGTAYQYRLKSSRNLYLTATTTEAHHPVKSEAYNANNENQKWVFLTDARIRTEMTKANADYPFNFTALLKSADFDLIEYEDGWTNNWDGFDWSGGGTNNMTGDGPFKGASSSWSADASQYVSYAYANSTNETTMSQDLGTLPNGTYNISFEGFYRSRYSYKGGFMNLQTKEADETRNAVVSFGSTNIAIPQNTSTTIGSGVDVVGPLFRDGDTYLKSQQVTMNSSASVTLKVTKPATSSTQVSAWICIDNFRLMYHGTGTAPIDPYKEFKDKVRTKVNETYPKVKELNAAGQAAYDIATVVSRYNNDQINSAADANAMCDMVDNAYANAYAAHRVKEIQDVIDAMGENGGDVTATIINPSFETGDLTGWATAGGGWDVGVQPNSVATFTTNGCDGAYLFNSYGGDNDHTAHIEQTITGIPNGLYELKVDVTSFADRYVYIFANGYNDKVATQNDKTNFHEATLYFLVEDGSAKIGAVGGNKGGGSTFIHYWPEQGCFFKADNFRLKYICDVPHGRLKLALNEAEAANLDAYGKAALDISTYQNTYTNKSLTGDGKAEVEAIYKALQTAAKVQRTVNADMTWAITNPNFETGDNTGWACETGNDTKVASQENKTYTIAGTDGRYLFNTWDNGTAKALTQTVTGIPNGTYKLTVMVASDANQQINLTANGVTTTIATSSNGAGSGVFPEVTCEVTDNKLEISVEGVNAIWYKVDNFRLTYVAPIAVEKVTLDKTTATIIENETLTLTATVTPDYATDKTVTWSTSDDKITTVDQNGKITAKVPGTVTITATSGDKSASCAVTVDYASYVFTLNVDEEKYFTQNVKRGTNLAAVLEENEVAMPTKTGYTFSGWALPEVMPAENLTLNGTYTINSYKVIFKIGEEFFEEKELEYGAAIVAPAAPVKEGYTFNGWGEVAETVPAEHVVYEGSYTVNTYTVTFQIGDEVISSEELEYGAAIEAPEAPAKEGYTFNGWGEVAETVPAEDVTYTGSYTVNKYTVTFQIGEDVISSVELEYGAAIEAPEAPAKEGYTFDGWGEVAKTVPAEDVVYEGSYTVNKYTVTFQIGEDVISSVELEYGAAIEAPEAPAKEGYTFNGWGEVAKTVPAEAVTYEGSYTVNKYKVSYIINGEVVFEHELEYGAAIEIPEELEAMYPGFEWIGEDPEEVYETMPASHIAFNGNDVTGLDRLSIDSNAVIYDLSGRRVLEAVKGFYIINGKKVFVK